MAPSPAKGRRRGSSLGSGVGLAEGCQPSWPSQGTLSEDACAQQPPRTRAPRPCCPHGSRGPGVIPSAATPRTGPRPPIENCTVTGLRCRHGLEVSSAASRLLVYSVRPAFPLVRSPQALLPGRGLVFTHTQCKCPLTIALLPVTRSSDSPRACERWRGFRTPLGGPGGPCVTDSRSRPAQRPCFPPTGPPCCRVQRPREPALFRSTPVPAAKLKCAPATKWRRVACSGHGGHSPHLRPSPRPTRPTDVSRHVLRSLTRCSGWGRPCGHRVTHELPDEPVWNDLLFSAEGSSVFFTTSQGKEHAGPCDLTSVSSGEMTCNFRSEWATSL